MSTSINFFNEEIDFELSREDALRITRWLEETAQTEGYEIEEINYIFCSDEHLLQINRQYLNHDYYTDIITFDNAIEDGQILSDIFISIDRVNDNAIEMNVPFQQELHRVIIHGLLHLLGFGDKTREEQTQMRNKEDACLSLLQ